MKTLEQENAELKGLMRKLESQLSDISTRSIVSNGEELKVGARVEWELCLCIQLTAPCASTAASMCPMPECLPP